MNDNRNQKIAEQLAYIPRAYRKTYARAVAGKSLRACINSQCLECVCWEREEVRLCTDLACPLYAVRPYQSLQTGRNEGFGDAESTNARQRVAD
jgi:hypothetical protein